jgi:hypothetical protein
MAQNRKDRLWVILGIVILLGLGSFYLFYLSRNTVVPASWGNDAGLRNSSYDWFNALQQALLAPILIAVLGILILRRFPRHRMGWLMIIIALTAAFMYVVGELTVYGYYTTPSPLPGVAWAAWITNVTWVVLFTLIMYLVAVFPSGTFVSRGWRTLLTFMLAWFTLPLFTAAAIESTMSSAYQIPNPISVNYSAPLYDILFLIGLPAMALTVLALVASAVARYRQGQGRERQQMKWLLAGVILMAVLVIVGLALSFGAGFPLGDIMVNVSLIGPVLGIGVAMLRHQLYDIDFIIRRTLVYAVVSTLLAGIYFGSVVVLQWLVSAVGGQQSGVVVAVSTLVIAALFSPLRRRVQTTVDRRFYRRKYDAAQTLAHFAATVQDETEISQLQQELAGVVIETMQPIHLSLWLKPEKSTLGKYPPDFGNG